MNIRYITVLLAVLSSSFVHAQAQSCPEGERNYKQCDTHLGWYLGGDLGYATTDRNNEELNQLFNDAGITANSVTIDNSDLSFSVFAGYQFSSYFAVEGGYLNLGERSVTFTGESTDVDNFYDNAEHIYPQSGSGFSAAIVGSLPITESFKLSAKIGYFDWQGDYNTVEPVGNVGSDSISGGDIWFGGELNYRVNDNFQAYLSAQHFELDRDKTTNFSLGIRYYFGHHKTAAVAPAIVPAIVPVIAPVIEPNDDDKDGVFNVNDACANTNLSHQVDAQGCTLMAEQLFDYSLVIYFANDSSAIQPQYFEQISELADIIQLFKVKSLKVYGHTSAPGSQTYNQKLSQKRAESIGEVLAEQFKIDKQLIEAIGKGEQALIDSSNTEAAHDVNRRIDLTVTETLVLPVTKSAD